MYGARIAPRPFANLLKPFSADIGKMGKGLSGQFPNFFKAALQILNVRRIDAASLIRPLCVLVQIVAAPLEQDDELAHLR